MQLLSQNLKIHLKCQTQTELWGASSHSVILRVEDQGVQGTSKARVSRIHEGGVLGSKF